MRDDVPLVSVVVPTWNGSDLLPECLSSIQGQTYARVETIVVDDGSSDGTADLVLDQFRSVRLVRLAKNRGFAAAVNAGIRAATGDIIALLNNDAVADPQWVEELA